MTEQTVTKSPEGPRIPQQSESPPGTEFVVSLMSHWRTCHITGNHPNRCASRQPHCGRQVFAVVPLLSE